MAALRPLLGRAAARRRRAATRWRLAGPSGPSCRRAALDGPLAFGCAPVGVAAGLEGLAQVVAQLLVLDQPLHVGASVSEWRCSPCPSLASWSPSSLLSFPRAVPGQHIRQTGSSPTQRERACASSAAASASPTSLDVDELELAALVLGDLVDLALVAVGHDHALDPRALRRERLLLEPADRQHLPGQRDLAGHRDVVADRAPAEQRGRAPSASRRRPRGRPWGRRPAGTWMWMSCSANQSPALELGQELGGLAADPATAPPAPTRASRRRAGR